MKLLRKGKEKVSKVKKEKIKKSRGGINKIKHRDAKGKATKNNKKFSLHNISIGWKYGIVIITIFILLSISTALVSQTLFDIQDNMDTVEAQGDRAVLTTELSAQIQSKGLSAMNFIQFGNETHRSDFETKKARIDELLEFLGENIQNENQQSLYNEVLANNQALDDMFYNDIMENVGATEDIRRLYSNRFSSSTNTTSLYLEYLRDMIIEDRDQAVADADQSQAFAMTMLLASMLISLIIGLVLVLIISRYVSKHLNRVVKTSDQIATGDLTAETINYQGKDEIGRLSSSINTMKAQLITMINQISETSNQVRSESEQLNQSANDVKTGTEQIAITMEELATGTESQATYAGDLAETMKAFADRINAIGASSETINDSSRVVLEETQAGNTYMEKSISQMTTIDQIVKDAVKKVSGLDEQSKQITKLVGVIKDIADQTNLLALNAAIEAARAGEHGKGFAVVADEVRKLAEQVNDSIGDITGIVQTIQQESRSVSDALSKGNQEVEQGKDDIERTGVRFKSIEEAIATMTTHVQTVMDGLVTLAADSEQVNGSVQEIASISEESAAGVEETSASAEEASTSMEEVASGSQMLMDSANRLNELIRQFKIDEKHNKI
ncbi:methyl-accepting chemotaxis protein [Streptohalobacillus salinus]|uniref:Methyl-accepting chemotaxis protein n=1 Tax=Streptohalobacillus salinus TaxID=621096 RepID=A0A2V3W4D9_9BACI|nr:methyl-accepting chemotaxis protein [Streptohalobacillus salinus]PXW88972.1 methyl-accepting chemotaxis protein [Streptohalobacillus salinus]